ncbi:MAG TPA: nucleoside 2-deoxyribosyltransferase, partial [Bacteroidota bacterium]
MVNRLRTPDFTRLTKTLQGGQADAVPLIELGIHPSIKDALLGRPVLTLRDDCDVMAALGYDFVKIQPGIRFEINAATRPSTHQPGDMTATSREWAPEGGGLITSWADFERYPWPAPSDIDYRRFEEARTALPDGMGVIGQYGDIFTVAWELMGFQNFAIALYEQPDLVKAIYDRVEGLILSMFKTMASCEIVGALWFSDDIAYTA